MSDYYCALCGGPLDRPFWEPSDFQGGDNHDDASEIEYDEPSYDPAIISSRDDPQLNWLERFRLIGEATGDLGTNTRGPWISGPAEYSEHNMITVTGNEDDPGGWEAEFEAYIGQGFPEGIPFHYNCQHLLTQYVGVETMDPQVLLETLKDFNVDHTPWIASHLPKVDYGVIGELMDQAWIVQPGTEWMIMDPVDVPELQDYIENLPVYDPSDADESMDLGPPTKPDPFSQFAPEIISHVMSYLDISGVTRFRQASRVASGASLSNGFWKNQLLSHVPWLYDIPQSTINSTTVDWKKVLKVITLASRTSSPSVIHGLANRRRIWEQILPQIGRSYLKNLEIKNKARYAEPDLLKKAKCTKSAHLVHPEPKDAKASTVALLPTVFPIAGVTLEVRVFFNDKYEVSSISAVNYSHPGLNDDFGDRPEGHDQFGSVHFPDHDWIVGFIAFSKEKPDEEQDDGVSRRVVGIEILFAKRNPVLFGSKGDRTLIYVPEGRVVVGFKLHTSKKKQSLCRIGLLHHAESYLANGQGRIQDRRRHMYSADTARFLWRPELPPPELTATDIAFGYWQAARGLKNHNAPLEALVFGKNEEELADVTSIKADVQFGGFEVTYGSRESRFIGPKHQAMKTFSIDGKGGERVVTFHTCCAHQVISLRLVTNRGRQLVLGSPYHREERQPVAMENGLLPTVGGIYGVWGKEGSPKTSLDGIGCLMIPQIEGPNPAGLSEASQQVGGKLWEPQSPPSTLKEQGLILGEHEQGSTKFRRGHAVPEDTPVWQWLDCSRPISQVDVTFCHNMGAHEIPIVALSFKYADGEGERAVTGPDTFPSPPRDTEGKNGHYFCWCTLATGMDKKELEERPHYMNHSWNVGGKRLTALRAWMTERPAMFESKDRTIGAIQVIAEDGVESPIWRAYGHTGEGDEIREIKFTAGGGDAVGLKFFFGDNNRPVTRSDMTIQGIQALVKSGA